MGQPKEKLQIDNPYVKRPLPKWDHLWFGLMMVVAVALFYLYGAILSFLFKILAPSTPNVVYHLRPPDGAWQFVGLVLSVGTTGIVMIYLYKVYLKAKYKPNLYVKDYFSKRTVEGYGLVKAIAWILTAVALFFTVHLYDNYVVVDKQSITLNEFLRFGKKTYSLHDIKALQHVRVMDDEGNQVHTNYRILFKDGYSFDSRDNMLDDKGLLPYLSAACNRTVDTVERR
jgi:hypothetical protein